MAEAIGGYRLMHVLGRGGMGEVLLGVSERDGTPVALKVARQALGPQGIARMRREAELLSRVAAPGLPRYLDAFEAEGIFVLVMEFVRGISLEIPMRELALPEDRIRLVRRVVPGLAGALVELARHEIVHRDVKPANLLLCDDRTVLVDLGLAWAADVKTLTKTGAALGTPHYFSPEMVLGEPLGSASDLYQAALVVHDLLVSRPSLGLQASLKEAMARATRRFPDPRREAPWIKDDLAEWLLLALHPDPGLRPPLEAHLSRLREMLPELAPEGVESSSSGEGEVAFELAEVARVRERERRTGWTGEQAVGSPAQAEAPAGAPGEGQGKAGSRAPTIAEATPEAFHDPAASGRDASPGQERVPGRVRNAVPVAGAEGKKSSRPPGPGPERRGPARGEVREAEGRLASGGSRLGVALVAAGLGWVLGWLWPGASPPGGPGPDEEIVLVVEGGRVSLGEGLAEGTRVELGPAVLSPGGEAVGLSGLGPRESGLEVRCGSRVGRVPVPPGESWGERIGFGDAGGELSLDLGPGAGSGTSIGLVGTRARYQVTGQGSVALALPRELSGERTLVLELRTGPGYMVKERIDLAGRFAARVASLLAAPAGEAGDRALGRVMDSPLLEDAARYHGYLRLIPGVVREWLAHPASGGTRERTRWLGRRLRLGQEPELDRSGVVVRSLDSGIRLGLDAGFRRLIGSKEGDRVESFRDETGVLRLRIPGLPVASPRAVEIGMMGAGMVGQVVLRLHLPGERVLLVPMGQASGWRYQTVPPNWLWEGVGPDGELEIGLSFVTGEGYLVPDNAALNPLEIRFEVGS